MLDTTKISAIVHGDIPKNRLVCLTKPEGIEDESIYIRLAKAKERPDFVSTEDLSDGQEASIEIKGSPIWEAEAQEDIPAGVTIATADEGKVKLGRFTSPIEEVGIGYSIHSAKAGEKIKFVRKYVVNEAWLDKVNQLIGE